MSGVEDRTLLLDVLRPFRRVIRPSSSPSSSSTTAASAPSTSAAGKLDFDESTLETILNKRKNSFKDDSSPVKRSKTDSGGDASSPCNSPWQINRYKIDALECRAQIEKLEKQLTHQHVICKEMQELFENERQKFINEKKSKENAVTDMEQKVRNLRTKETEVREQLSKTVKEFNDFKYMSEKERQSLQKEVYDVKAELSDSRIEANEQISKLKNEICELSQNFTVSQKELQHYKTAYEECSVTAQKYTDLQEAFDKQLVSLQQTEIRLREYENSVKDLEEIKVLQKRMINLPSLEREVVRLREETTELKAAARQNLLLEEQVHSYKKRLDSLEPLYQNYCDLKKSFSETEKMLDEWKRVGIAYEASEPQLLISQLENYQEKELTLSVDKKDIDLQLSATKTELMNAKHECKKTLSKLGDVQNIQKTQESFIHRLQKKLLLVSRERDSYRQQLDSYEKDLTINMGGDAQQSSAITNSRVEGLERTLQGYKDLITKMEDEMTTMKGTPAHQDQISRLKDEVLNLTKQNEMLRSHCDKMESKLENSMNYLENKSSSKVIHLLKNPLSKVEEDAKNELEKAHSEILQLKHKIKKLEANELEMTQRLSETLQNPGSLVDEYNQVKEQLESTKLKLQRMKEVFTSSSQEYRDVCYMLMGYKLDRIGVNNYRLSSMYADSPNQYLNFKLSDGEIEMVQTEYSALISDLVEHLQHHKSFPVFLSELTMDLFKKTTIID